ncbi:MAG TPA: dihydropteroate synthase [Burkholderiaceae bacterium]|nr:dihydropteroate synthase [Burkholderiaceae bacterium]
MAIWQTTRFKIDLSRPRVMGIVNVTPDSFSDGGRFASTDAAIAHCERLKAEGADILDIGGESTRPGSRTPPVEEELGRVLPVLRHAVTLGIPVSVDTSEPLVMRAAIELGVDIVNDVRALRREGALDLLAAQPATGVCLMHMPAEPEVMQVDPRYEDVVSDVARFLAERAARALEGGISKDRVVLDPGIGFGKTVPHNLALLRRQAEFMRLGYPLLVGWSRKTTLGRVTGREVGDRLLVSVVAALAAIQHGASIVRVHDVAATVDALKIWHAAGLCGQPGDEEDNR